MVEIASPRVLLSQDSSGGRNDIYFNSASIQPVNSLRSARVMSPM